MTVFGWRCRPASVLGKSHWIRPASLTSHRVAGEASQQGRLITKESRHQTVSRTTPPCGNLHRRVYWDTLAGVPLLTCDVPARGSSYGIAQGVGREGLRVVLSTFVSISISLGTGSMISRG